MNAWLVRITLQNGLPAALHWSTYGLAPTPWNGETLNVNLLESHRGDVGASLFVAAPVLSATGSCGALESRDSAG